MKLQLIFITAFFLVFNSMSAYADDNSAYFSVLTQIKKPPVGSAPILACNNAEEINHFLTLLKQKGSDPQLEKFIIQSLKLDKDHTTIEDDYGSYYTLYKGDFSNEGLTEYALVSINGTGEHSNDANVYKLFNGHLVDTGLDDIISRDLLHGSDVGPNFYNWVSDPFAFVLNGKTYLRYAQYPDSLTYDPTELRTCTYLLQDNKITLAGPNLRYSAKQKKIIEATDCIGDSRASKQ